MSTNNLNHALVRILIDNQQPPQPIGAGFLVSPTHILTCAHVVADALKIPRKTEAPPTAAIYLDFPLRPQPSPPLMATVTQWYPVKDSSVMGELEDIAVLEMTPVDSLSTVSVQAIQPVAQDSLFDRPVRMFGFPLGKDDGEWLGNHKLQGPIANGWVQLDKEGQRSVAPGFSGAPVWDKNDNTVVGMIVSIDRGQDTLAYMIPGATLLKACHDLFPPPPVFKSLDIDIPHPEGPIPPDSPFYVQRDPVESTCLGTIVKPGALINIKAPWHLGKTSLMNWILAQASGQNYRTVTVNLLSVDEECLKSVDNFLQWFCSMVTAELDAPDKVTEFWQSSLSAKPKCTNYFARYLLSASPLVIGLDNIDHIFSYPNIAEEFFVLLRLWHEKGMAEAKWKNLRLVTVYSKEPLSLSDLNKSPFNVGVPIELTEWTPAQVYDLVKKHGLLWEATQVKQLMEMVGGHPYLVRMALYQIAKQQITLPRLLELAPALEGPYSDHLSRCQSILEKKDNLRIALKQVVNANSPVQLGTTEVFKLRSLGLVKFQGNGVIPLCNLYREYFKKVL